MKCPICQKRDGVLPVQEGRGGKQIEFCEKCDLDLFDAGTLSKKLRLEIKRQITFHEEEGNEPAINSLCYIESLL